MFVHNHRNPLTVLLLHQNPIHLDFLIVFVQSFIVINQFLIKLLTEQYIVKQEQVRKELENKRSYLLDFQKTQSNENEQLNKKFQQIQNQLQILTEQYRQVKLILLFVHFFLFRI